MPLCLFDCSYSEYNLDWIFDEQILKGVLNHLQFVWAKHQVKYVFFFFSYFLALFTNKIYFFCQFINCFKFFRAEIVKSMINEIYPLIPSSNALKTIEGLNHFTLDHKPPKVYYLFV